MRLSLRNQIIVVFILSLLLIAGFSFFSYYPQFKKLKKIGDEKKKKEDEVDSAKATLKRLEDIKKDLPRIQAEVAEFNIKMPPAEDFPTLLKEIQRIAIEAGVNFSTLKTSALVSQPEYSELPLELTIDGYFRDLVDFLWRMRTLPREMKVTSVNIAEGENKLPHLKVTIKLSAFTTKVAAPTAPPSAGGGTSPGGTEQKSEEKSEEKPPEETEKPSSLGGTE